MGTHLTFQYDREADILYINTCEPYPEQESEELEDEVIARFNPKTDEIENLEVLFFLRDYYVKSFFNYQFPRICGGNQSMGQSKVKPYITQLLVDKPSVGKRRNSRELEFPPTQNTQ